MHKLAFAMACLVVSARGSRTPLKALASFLVARDPAAAFNPFIGNGASRGVHVLTSMPSLRRDPLIQMNAQDSTIRSEISEVSEVATSSNQTRAGEVHKTLSFSLRGVSETPFDSMPHIFEEDLSYPWTHIPQPFLEELFKVLQPKFLVEVGSYVGGSTRRIGEALLATSSKDDLPCLLCIDTFLGDAQLWLEDDKQWLQLQHGLPRLYWQFLENVKQFRDVVVPLPCSSLCALRVVQHLVLQRKVPAPTFIYLDTGHQKGETFNEIRQAFQLLAEGGVIVGDDLNWPSVESDVSEFVATGAEVTGEDDEVFSKLTGVSFNEEGGYWVLDGEAPQWLLRKKYGGLEDLWWHVQSEEPTTL